MDFSPVRAIGAAQASYQHFMLFPAIRGFPATPCGPNQSPAETSKVRAPYLAQQRMGTAMRIAVIGTGIAGNAAAWTLSKRYPVTVYDRELRPGGHSNTVSIDY
jgi:NADPH-dependent 2,4-dienoyl-CoA reductase/sulfur reductase-like enzyme